MVKTFLMRASFLFLLFPAVVSAATLDDYYLSKFGMQAKAARALSAVVEQKAEHAERCRTHLYRSLKRDWSSLEPTTQKVLAKYVSRPVLADSATFTSSNFNIHYANSGDDAPDLTDADADQVPDWVERVSAVFEEVYAVEVTGMGYRPPPVARYDVYLSDLAADGAYGFTTDDGQPAFPAVSVGSYIEIDRAFTDGIFTENGRYTPDQMLQITAAHEFHHAIQFGYNYYFDIWYAEVTSTWMEDEIYDSVNQLYSYLPAYLPRSSTLSLDAPLGLNSEYGRWIFNRYLAERHNTAQVVRSVWERLATLHPTTSPTTSDGDIQMSPVIDTAISSSGSTLSSDFFGFSRKMYTKDWTTHASDVSKIPTVAPVATFSDYPVTSSTATASIVTLLPFTFSYYRFLPSSTAPFDLNIILSNVSNGTDVIAFKKGTDGSINTYGVDRATGIIKVPSFNTAQTAEVQLLISNGSFSDSVRAGFSTDDTSFTPDGGGISGLAKDISGAGITGIFVSVYDAASNSFLRSTFTDATGNYSIGNLAGGSYKVGYNGSSRGYVNQYNNNKANVSIADSITVVAGSVTTAPTATMQMGGTISGEVRKSDGTGIGGIAVIVYDIATAYSTSVVTAADGTYAVRGLPPGNYKVNFSAGLGFVGQWSQNASTMQTADVVTVLINSHSSAVDATLLPVVTTSVPVTTEPDSSGGGGGCFIATAAYGSYLHPKVAELRSFRDRYLLTNAPGRLFVALYYRLSPPVARVIGEHEWMRGGVRLLLLPVVLAVEHPGGALLVLMLSGGGAVFGLVRRRRSIRPAVVSSAGAH